MRKVYLLICACMLAVLLTACAERYETTIVEAIVIEKEYDPAKTKTKKQSDGRIKKVHEPEEYEVTLRYGDIEKEFESSNDDFYDSVREGDKVKVHLVQGFDDEDKVVHEYLELIE